MNKISYDKIGEIEIRVDKNNNLVFSNSDPNPTQINFKESFEKIGFGTDANKEFSLDPFNEIDAIGWAEIKFPYNIAGSEKYFPEIEIIIQDGFKIFNIGSDDVRVTFAGESEFFKTKFSRKDTELDALMQKVGGVRFSFNSKRTLVIKEEKSDEGVGFLILAYEY